MLVKRKCHYLCDSIKPYIVGYFQSQDLILTLIQYALVNLSPRNTHTHTHWGKSWVWRRRQSASK